MQLQLCVTCLLILSAAASVAAGETVATDVAVAQIDDWVHDLNADQYETRKAATQQLIEAGAPSIQPVAQAVMESGNLEVQIRGLEVLEELAISEDATLGGLAWDALQRIASSRALGAARRAEECLKSLADVRSERALQKLVQLGVDLKLTPGRQIVIGPQLRRQQIAIQIGEEWSGSDNDLELLRELTNVTQVELEGQKITDAVLTHVAEMDALQHLAVRHSRISDEGLAKLTRLNGLLTLSIRYAALTDNSLPHLIKMRRPHLIELYGTEITTEGAALGKQLPHVALDVRRGAFLGVGPPQLVIPGQVPGCLLGEVRPGSAAERAGLLRGDVITTYDGQPVADFEQLRSLIARNRAGDKVKVEILRGGQPTNKEIVLGEWK